MKKYWRKQKNNVIMKIFHSILIIESYKLIILSNEFPKGLLEVQ